MPFFDKAGKGCIGIAAKVEGALYFAFVDIAFDALHEIRVLFRSTFDNDAALGSDVYTQQ